MPVETISDLLSSANQNAQAVVVPQGGPTLTYGEFNDEVERVAGLLAARGVQRGRAVSIILPNGLDFMTLFMAVARVGAIAAPLNSAYRVDEFTFYMEDAGSQLAILPPGEHEGRDAAKALGIPVLEARLAGARTVLEADGVELTASRDAAPPKPDDVALFLHTSGTTSRPKGVPLTHGNLVASLRNISGTYELSPQDVAMVVMPLFHVHGLIGVALSTFYAGGSIVIPPRFSASAFWTVQAETGATWYSAVPTIHQVLLLRADEDNAPHESFRFIRSCSAALAPSVFHNLEKRFGAPVLEAYGMTEASHQMASSPLPPRDRRPGTVGMPTGVEVAIMDMDGKGQILSAGSVGEVVIKGPNVMHGYNNNPEANKEAFVNGWFRTGDQGVMDESRYLALTGRIKELINRAGEKISPLEVDAVLLQHDCVSEAVCFAVPDEKYGEVVHAAVVLKKDTDAESIRQFCSQHLAGFKVPDVVYIADSLPRTATGKIQRRHVSAAFAGSANAG